MRVDINEVIGLSPDLLSIEQRRALTGQWAAFAIYTPQNLALRKIEAVGASVADCARQLTARGLDPTRYEFLPIAPAY